MDDRIPPISLKRWFIIHFAVDLIFAIPLFFFPVYFLNLIGWQAIDPFATRIVAAALLGIGIESFLGRNANIQTYKSMLNLKIIWSGATIAGVGLSIYQNPQVSAPIYWVLLTIFIAFHLLWVWWRLKIVRV